MATNVFESLRQPVSVCHLICNGKQFRFFQNNLDVDKVRAVFTDLSFFCSQASKWPLILFQMWVNNEKYFSFFFMASFFVKTLPPFSPFLRCRFWQTEKIEGQKLPRLQKVPLKNQKQLPTYNHTLCYLFGVCVCTAFWTPLFLQKM